MSNIRSFTSLLARKSAISATIPQNNIVALYAPRRNFNNQSFMVTCIDKRLNEMLSVLFPDFFTARYAGGAISDNVELGKLAVGNTTRVLNKLDNFVVLMHQDCKMIDAVRNELAGLAAPVINGSFNKLGRDASESDVIIACLQTSMKNLHDQYNIKGASVGLCLDVHNQKINILQDNKLVLLDDSIPNPENNPTLAKTYDTIRKFNSGLSLDVIRQIVRIPAASKGESKDLL
ncbi:MAG: hypothetical protein K0R98_673 [Rickettsiaceae bacterium]|jgi:carbonic anhydrase|nr:hypothetical protein [Rickettsiaceae bacterium]